MTTPTMTSIPTVPSEDILLAMARRAYPGFDSVTDLDGKAVGINERDRAKVISAMRSVYAVVLGQSLAEEPEGGDTAQEAVPRADDSAWFHSEWLQGMSPNALTSFLSHFNAIAPLHWKAASDISAGVGFPVVMKNDRIGPMLAERVEEDGQSGFLPYVPGLDSGGIRWHIADDKLERWRLAKVPGSARGWVELFTPDRADAKARSQVVAPLFERVKALVASGAGDNEVIEAMGAMFEALQKD